MITIVWTGMRHIVLRISIHRCTSLWSTPRYRLLEVGSGYRCHRFEAKWVVVHVCRERNLISRASWGIRSIVIMELVSSWLGGTNEAMLWQTGRKRMVRCHKRVGLGHTSHTIGVEEVEILSLGHRLGSNRVRIYRGLGISHILWHLCRHIVEHRWRSGGDTIGGRIEPGTHLRNTEGNAVHVKRAASLQLLPANGCDGRWILVNGTDHSVLVDGGRLD